MKEPVLVAFEQEDGPGRYNVWRYDTRPTQCVLWGCLAASEEEAKQLALDKINRNNEAGNSAT